MIKNLITRLYEKYCAEPKKEYSPFEVVKQELTQDELFHLYTSCKLIMDQGIFMKVVDMVIAESQDEQLEKKSCTPIYTTEAELERLRRDGIGRLVERINLFASKAIQDKQEEFDEYAAI